MTDIVTLPDRAVRTRFIWILPVLFAVGTTLGTVWPGHGNTLFCVGALAGIWACYLLGASGDVESWLLPALAGGVPILLLLGLLLDRIETDLRIWFAVLCLVSAATAYVMLQGFPEVGQAIEYHGSLAAFVVCAVQLGSYGATVVLLAFGAGGRR